MTKIILRSIDGAVRDSLKEAAKQANMAARKQSRASKAAAKNNARVSKKPAKATASKAKKGARGQSEAGETSGTQLELRLDLADVRSQKAPRASRVRADSILGAELSSGIDADGTSPQGQLGSAFSASAATPSESQVRPEPPLFVHRRARDGQIHALRRVGEGGEKASDDRAGGSSVEGG